MYQLNYGISDTPRNAFQLMIDINRCLLLTTLPSMNRLIISGHFSTLLSELCEIVPTQPDNRLSLKRL
jgi:hypothetical protein